MAEVVNVAQLAAGAASRGFSTDALQRFPTICVTGATGYVAGWIVKLLLDAGHTVHATVRDPDNTQSVAHLQDLEGAAERLKLFKADLLVHGSFDWALQGCQALIHTASPYAVDVPSHLAYDAIIRPAVEGTENVLASVSRTPSITKVVLTASTAAVFTDPHERGRGHVFTEADWNLTANPTDLPYFHAKTLAEQRAYELEAAAGGSWQLARINPGAIWGPPLSARRDGESINHMLDLLSGFLFPFAPTLGMATVDVRDVAKAHYLALITPCARGRYLINAGSGFQLLQAARCLRRARPRITRRLPLLGAPRPLALLLGPLLGLPRALGRAMLGKVPVISTAKAERDLGLTEYIDPATTVTDMADALLAKGMVRPRASVQVGIMGVAAVSALLSAVLLVMLLV